MKFTIPFLKSAAALAAFAALSVCFTSCKDDEPIDDGGTTTPALTITVSDAGEAVQLAEGTTVGVIAVRNGTALTQATVTAQADGQLANTDSLTAVMQDGVELCAYSPAGLWTTDTYSRAITFSVPSDQRAATDYAAADLMLAPLTAVSDGKAQLVLNHVMARVVIHITDVTGNYDLTDLTMVLPGRYTTVTADLASATATTDTGLTADLTAYTPSNTIYRATGAAVVAPGAVESGSRLVDVTIGGETFAYILYENLEWEAGYEYVYTMRLTEEGLTSYSGTVNSWDDSDLSLSGEAEEAFIYGVGDYLLADGSFVKANRITASDAANVVAVVFSEDVSDADASAGYNAYAMGVERLTGVVLGFTDAVSESITDWPSALADLDGRLKTAAMQASDAYQAIADKSNTAFEALSSYTSSYPVSASTSGWFVPSIGQLLQILNHLGQAGLTEDTEVSISTNNSSIFTSDDLTVLESLNAPLTAIGLSELFPVSESVIYLSSSEYNVDSYTNFWCVQTTGTTWGFGKNAQRGSTSGRSLVPCVAVTLPDME